MMRIDGRAWNELRNVTIVPNYLAFPEGSVLISFGKTQVICAASVDERVPGWLLGSRKGWVTAEYSMLPRATLRRTNRESSIGKISGRTQEIQRLIGRALRGVVQLEKLGERTITVDCDVIQADGGTRTAAITGAYAALHLALERLFTAGVLQELPLLGSVAAVSVGYLGGELILDLCYEEDHRAEVDMNVVITGSGQFIEVQGTAEGRPFDRNQLLSMIDLAGQGVERLTAIQLEAIRNAKLD